MDFGKEFKQKKISPYVAPGLKKKLRNLDLIHKDLTIDWIKEKEVIKVVEDWTGYRIEKLKKRNGTRPIVYAKKYLIWYLWKMTASGKSDIARLLLLHHSTILNALSDLKDLMDSNEFIKNDVEALGEKLKQK